MRIAFGRSVLTAALLMGLGGMVTVNAAETAKPAKPAKKEMTKKVVKSTKSAPAKKEMAKKVVKPTKSARAKAPPTGAKASKALVFNKAAKWKTDAKTHSVFSVGADKQIWFLDPSSGWPYTIDSRGIVYTADPLGGIVYDLGRLSNWVGDVLYFFGYWDFSNGSYSLSSRDEYYTIYDNSSYDVYTYDTAYDEVWEYDSYFESQEFVSETVDIEYYEETSESTTETTTETSSEVTEENSSDHEDEADAHQDAADAHEDAAEAHEDAADAHEDAADEAEDAADDAEDAADDADDSSDDSDDSGGDSDDSGGDSDDSDDSGEGTMPR